MRDQRLDASFYYGDLSSAEVAGLALTELAYRVAAPAVWSKRLHDADWSALAAMPWILTPPISTHHRLVSGLFDRHGVAPSKVIEADNEGVILNLVASGLGLSLVREDLVLGDRRTPGVCIWEKARLMTTLWFIYRSDRAQDPLIAAMLAILGETWQRNSHPDTAVRPAASAPHDPLARPRAPLRRSP